MRRSLSCAFSLLTVSLYELLASAIKDWDTSLTHELTYSFKIDFEPSFSLVASHSTFLLCRYWEHMHEESYLLNMYSIHARGTLWANVSAVKYLLLLVY